jgi:hypothetical protein
MKYSRRTPRPVGGDKCGVGGRGMQSPSYRFFKMSNPSVGVVIHFSVLTGEVHLSYKKSGIKRSFSFHGIVLLSVTF